MRGQPEHLASIKRRWAHNAVEEVASRGTTWAWGTILNPRVVNVIIAFNGPGTGKRETEYTYERCRRYVRERALNDVWKCDVVGLHVLCVCACPLGFG